MGCSSRVGAQRVGYHHSGWEIRDFSSPVCLLVAESMSSQIMNNLLAWKNVKFPVSSAHPPTTQTFCSPNIALRKGPVNVDFPHLLHLAILLLMVNTLRIDIHNNTLTAKSLRRSLHKLWIFTSG